ncbi:MAG: bifunctional phosphopantothenoylcysteine decarboxylase/phosphopantothenate--cysteine ligase CoaBC [Desulfobacteraceae bacterium]|nr:bifunctional phosphopantothenoylcysteine decarboxylase/phosphopantothenate--cysteine ligase CoaBC [Desulfobacteraceae bacterium]
MTTTLNGKKIVLGVCGGIAAYKSVELLRQIIKRDACVKVVMTANAAHFVGPVTFEALSRQAVYRDLFESKGDASIRHIDWAEEADAVIIAPATANIISKMAHGLADDALSTFLLAVTCPVIVCPSMNTNMYTSKQVQKNIDTLKNFGFQVVEPDAGELACGTTGPGRLPGPEVIVDVLEKLLTPKDFSGKNFLVTAGPTREAIDPVRFISNPSSGKMGYAVAKAAEMRGANVVLITGPTQLTPASRILVKKVVSAEQMCNAVLDYADHADIIIKCAAVSDYRPCVFENQKIKKTEDSVELKLQRTQDILKAVSERKNKQFVVGFAAETQDLDTYAIGKLQTKKLDLIVGNLIGEKDSGFESSTNKVVLFYKDGKRESLDVMPKQQLAHLLLDRIAENVKG